LKKITNFVNSENMDYYVKQAGLPTEGVMNLLLQPKHCLKWCLQPKGQSLKQNRQVKCLNGNKMIHLSKKLVCNRILKKEKF